MLHFKINYNFEVIKKKKNETSKCSVAISYIFHISRCRLLQAVNSQRVSRIHQIA